MGNSTGQIIWFLQKIINCKEEKKEMEGELIDLSKNFKISTNCSVWTLFNLNSNKLSKNYDMYDTTGKVNIT